MSMQTDQKKMEVLYEGIFGAITGMFGEEGSTDSYINHWKAFSKRVAGIADQYVKKVIGLYGGSGMPMLKPDRGSMAQNTFNRIFYLKNFLEKQEKTATDYEKFSCTLSKETQSKRLAQNTKVEVINPKQLRLGEKLETDLNMAKMLAKYNSEFLGDLNTEIENFELTAIKKFKDAKAPHRVNREASGRIWSKMSDIKKCFPECPGYVSRY